uniref:Uncharacterized protein n=1 Tax=Ignisphaera aggregans TaxID=334771 RepID=A0A7C2Z9H5_9CREN
MNLKKETRLLLVSEIDGYIVGVVIRGYAGIEGVSVYRSCFELYNALLSKKGILAEVNYVVEVGSCRNINNIKALRLEDIEDRDIKKAVEETIRIIELAKLRFRQLKAMQIY